MRQSEPAWLYPLGQLCRICQPTSCGLKRGRFTRGDELCDGGGPWLPVCDLVSRGCGSSACAGWRVGGCARVRRGGPLCGDDCSRAWRAYISDGDFNVRLKIEDTCGIDSTSQEIKIKITTRNGIINKKTYKIYPNPTSSSVTIDSESNLDMRIISVSGKVVYEGNIIKEQSKRINLEHLANGLYLIELERNGKKSTHTILKIEGL